MVLSFEPVITIVSTVIITWASPLQPETFNGTKKQILSLDSSANAVNSQWIVILLYLHCLNQIELPHRNWILSPKEEPMVCQAGWRPN